VGTCVDDVAALYAAISGADGRDGICSSPRSSVDSILASVASFSLSGVRIGIPLECHVEGMSGSILGSWRDAASVLAHAGATVVDVSIPSISSSLAAYYVIVSAEASSNLARYDGARQRNESVQVEQLASSGLDRAQSSTAFRTSSFGAEVSFCTPNWLYLLLKLLIFRCSDAFLQERLF
jgi:aspartyl-tRNA(Asn)/glutamyl-tRNA(Gln) amidotransferase subunit A